MRQGSPVVLFKGWSETLRAWSKTLRAWSETLRAWSETLLGVYLWLWSSCYASREPLKAFKSLLWLQNFDPHIGRRRKHMSLVLRGSLSVTLHLLKAVEVLLLWVVSFSILGTNFLVWMLCHSFSSVRVHCCSLHFRGFTFVFQLILMMCLYVWDCVVLYDYIWWFIFNFWLLWSDLSIMFLILD